MAIEWTTRPAYGWGGGAAPVEYGSIMRRLFENYSPDVYTITMTQDYYGLEGVNHLSSNMPTNARGATNVEGVARNLGCWIGRTDYPAAADLPLKGTFFTLVYPNADLQLSVGYNIESWDAVNKLYNVFIGFNWFKASDHTPATTPAGGSLMTSVSIIPKYTDASPFPGMPAYGPPGECACYWAEAGKMYFGVTTFSGGSNTSDPSRINDSALVIDIDRYSAYLHRLNPTIDFGVYETDPYSPEVGEPSKQGGYDPSSSKDPWSSDIVGLPEMPSLSAIDIGFVNMYKPEPGDLVDLGSEIFPDFNFSPVTGVDIVDAFINACANIPNAIEMFVNSKLIDYVQDCHLIPVAPATSGSASIKLGFRYMNASCPVVTSEYVDFPCGQINVQQCWSNFADYQPYTRAKLFLPFVGYVPIEPEYWQNGSLAVDYRFNVRDGSFMAFVRAFPDMSKGYRMPGQVIGSYGGNACIHIPLTGLNYSSMISGIVGGAAATMASVAGGGGIAASAAAALNTAAAAPQVQSSNGYTGASAFLGIRYPFLIIERSIPQYSAKYQHDVGMPSYIATQLGNASGFVKVTDVDLSGFQATDAEKAEIRKLLAAGIYV